MEWMSWVCLLLLPLFHRGLTKSVRESLHLGAVNIGFEFSIR